MTFKQQKGRLDKCADSCTLNFGKIPEAIVVEEGADLEWHSMILTGQASSIEVVTGVYSRYRANSVAMWPSLVLLPGSQVKSSFQKSIIKMILA